MDRDRVMLVFFLVLSALAAGVMYGLFRGDTFKQFEMSRLYFAAAVLAFLAFIFLFSMILYVFGSDHAPGADSPGKAIFDSCVKVIPPIATLIIGFYFGTYQASGKLEGANAQVPSQASPQTPQPKPQQ
jgi:hypothetical protein